MPLARGQGEQQAGGETGGEGLAEQCGGVVMAGLLGTECPYAPVDGGADQVGLKGR